MTTTTAAVQDVMGRPTADTVQVTFRVPSYWLQEADAVAMALSRFGMDATRTDAFREAIARGFKEIIKESAEASYRVSAWDGTRTTCLFWIGRDETDALAKADELSAEHRGDRWTVFRVYRGDERKPLYEAAVAKTPAQGVRKRAEALAKRADAEDRKKR